MREKTMIDICIIGGGAAGMTAAICIKEENPELTVLILEKKEQTGKKILASGNGRCNLSNVRCPGAEETLRFFHRLGILTRCDDAGRIYPHTEEARTVRDGLLQRLHTLGVQVETGAEVCSVDQTADGFAVSLRHKTLRASKVLIACGGKAGPAFGTIGDGFRFAKALGHHVAKPVPVLTAVELKEDMHALSGIRAKAEVKLEYAGEEIFCERGEVQFTDGGISGICVFNLSRFLLLPQGKTMADGFDDYGIFVDFFPEEEGLTRLRDMLRERQALGYAGSDIPGLLVRKPIAERIAAMCAGTDDPEQSGVEKMAALLRRFPLSPKGVRGWDFAQVTKGGVVLREVDPQTQQSLLVPGLYFAGEVLDFDGPCGGYNLQNAWETGMRAGKGMAR
jgi:hypothetical protein